MSPRRPTPLPGGVGPATSRRKNFHGKGKDPAAPYVWPGYEFHSQPESGVNSGFLLPETKGRPFLPACGRDLAWHVTDTRR